MCAQAESLPSAEPGVTAEALTQSAIAAFDRCEYPTALALLRRASVLAPTPLVGLYVARSHAALGMLVEAAEDYRSVVESVDEADSSSSRARAAEAARDELAQLRPRIPSVEFALGDSELRSRNLRLVVDGRLVRPGAPAQMNPGHHEVIASDADGEKARLAFDAAEGERKTLGLSWRTDSRPGKDEPFPSGNGPSSTRHTLGVVALTVGATGLGVGTVTGVAALSKLPPGAQHCPGMKCTEGPQIPENSSAFVALRTISAAGFVVGGAGIGTWLGLLLTTPAQSASSEHPKVSPWTPVVGMGSAGARYMF